MPRTRQARTPSRVDMYDSRHPRPTCRTRFGASTAGNTALAPSRRAPARRPPAGSSRNSDFICSAGTLRTPAKTDVPCNPNGRPVEGASCPARSCRLHPTRSPTTPDRAAAAAAAARPAAPPAQNQVCRWHRRRTPPAPCQHVVRAGLGRGVAGSHAAAPGQGWAAGPSPPGKHRQLRPARFSAPARTGRPAAGVRGP